MDLKNLVTLFVDVGTWSGTGRIDPKDLGIPSDVIPPREIASMGTIRLIEKEELHDFDNIRKAAHRACRQVGVQFLGGYAIPSHKAKALQVELDELRARYEEARAKLLERFRESVTNFSAKYPSYAEVILAKVPQKDYLARQLRFKIDAAKVSNASEFTSFFQDTARQLWRVLLEEVAADAGRAYEESFMGRTEVTQRALRPLRAIADKIDGLLILNGNVSKISLYVHQVIDSMPKTGKVSGRDLAAAQGLLNTLSTPDQIERAINGFDPEPDDSQGLPVAALPAPIPAATTATPAVDVPTAQPTTGWF